MPAMKEDKTKKSVYKNTVPNQGTPYKDPANVCESLIGLKTTVPPREGFHVYWARDDEVRIRVLEGYEIADIIHYPHLSALAFQDTDSTKGSTIRLPSQDSDKDLVLLEIPLELYNEKKAKEYAKCDEIEAQIKGTKNSNPRAGVAVTSKGRGV